MTFLDPLNPQQREAAETLNGPLLIVAGAGSGKTKALTYRIANLIAQNAAHPWQILAVTFTNKAAKEMERRVAELMETNFEGLHPKNKPMIGTFHSVCLHLLRHHAEKAGLRSGFAIYDSDDSRSLMKRILKEQSIDDEQMKPQMVLGTISRLKHQLQTASDLAGHASNTYEKQAAQLFDLYQKRLTQNNAVDFDDLIGLAVRLLQEHPQVLEECQERWRYLSIDEYQDTNHAQYALVRLLAAKYRNLCVIGDSDQSIYRFRGADLRNILEFERDYPEAKIIKLEQNYRSTQTILDAADAIIEKNVGRTPKKMWTDRGGGDLVEVIHAQNEQEEAQTVAQRVRQLQQQGVPANHMVVLYRTHAQSRVLEEAFLRHGLPYTVIGGVKFYARKEIKDILAYLRVVQNPYDSESLLRIINIPPRRLGPGTLQKLQAFALARSLALGELLKHAEMIEELSKGAKQSLAMFWRSIELWREEAQSRTVSQLMRRIIDQIGYQAYLNDGTEEGEMRWENVLELESVSAKYDGLEPRESLDSFLEEVALVADADGLKSNEPMVPLMTLHSVKGLEFPYVFIVGCEENVFPHSRSLADPAEMEEERRLMYVGVTRAMQKLILLCAQRRQLYGDFQSNPVSRFVADIPEHLMDRQGQASSAGFLRPYSGTSQQAWGSSAKPVVSSDGSDYGNPFDQRPEEEVQPKSKGRFQDGEKVRHKDYGEGVVVQVKGDVVTVAFSNKFLGIKRFAGSIAPLERI